MVEVVVDTVNDKARTVQLASKEATARTVTRSDNMTLRGLRPGMLVSATVQKVGAQSRRGAGGERALTVLGFPE